MAEKFQNKYRIASARLPNWGYGWNAMYFVTICSQNRECYFGNVIDGEMRLSEIGKIVEEEWEKTFEMRPDMCLQKDEYMVMPNHFHAIIVIGKNQYNVEGNAQCNTKGKDAMHCVSTNNKFAPQSKNLAAIIRGFKSGVTINARKIDADFALQARFHDHIIRNDDSYHRIRNYISENPVKWSDDKFYNIDYKTY